MDSYTRNDLRLNLKWGEVLVVDAVEMRNKKPQMPLDSLFRISA